MNSKKTALSTAAISDFGLSSQATTYLGNGSTSFNLTGSLGYGGTQTETAFATYVTTVPEPSSMVLGAVGLATLLRLRHRR